MVCHWKLADRPQGISFSSGRAGTTGTTETAEKWQAMLPLSATGPCEAREPIPSAKHLPGTIPVVSAVPAVPVAGSSPAKRPGAYLGHWRAALLPAQAPASAIGALPCYRPALATKHPDEQMASPLA